MMARPDFLGVNGGTGMRFAVAAVGLLASVIHASASELHLVCNYEQTSTIEGGARATAGEIGVRIIFMKLVGPKNVSVKTTNGPCSQFIADGDDLQIAGDCRGMVAGDRLYRSFKLNRLSGVLEDLLHFENKQSGKPDLLLQSGLCRPSR